MTKLAIQTVLINLEMSRSLDDMPWNVIKDIAASKIYDRDIIRWIQSINHGE